MFTGIKKNYLIGGILIVLIVVTSYLFIFTDYFKDSDLEYQERVQGLRLKAEKGNSTFIENPTMNLTITPEVATVYYTSNGFSKATHDILLCMKVAVLSPPNNFGLRFNNPVQDISLTEIKYENITTGTYYTYKQSTLGNHGNGSAIVITTPVLNNYTGFRNVYYELPVLQTTLTNQFVYYFDGVEVDPLNCKRYLFQYTPLEEDTTFKWDAYFWEGNIISPTYSLLLDPNWILESSEFQIDNFTGDMADDGQNLSLSFLNGNLSGSTQSVGYCPTGSSVNITLIDWNVPYPNYGIADVEDSSRMVYLLHLNESGTNGLIENITNIGWSPAGVSSPSHTGGCVIHNCSSIDGVGERWARDTIQDNNIEDTNLSIEVWVRGASGSDCGTENECVIYSYISDDSQNQIKLKTSESGGILVVDLDIGGVNLQIDSNQNIRDGQWHHVYASIGVERNITVDGVSVETNNPNYGVLPLSPATNYIIHHIGNGKNGQSAWIGEIDELRIRSDKAGSTGYLTKSEIVQHYREEGAKYDLRIRTGIDNATMFTLPYTNFSGSGGMTQNNTLNLTGNCFQWMYYGYNVNESMSDPFLMSINFTYESLLVSGVGDIIAAGLRLYTPSRLNLTNEDVFVEFTPISTNNLNFEVNLTWILNGVNNLSFNNLSVINNTITTFSLTSENTTRGDNWTIGVTLYDAFPRHNQTNSSQLIVRNSPPTVPDIISPPNNTITGNYSINLTCSGSTDIIDNDVISYEFWADKNNPPTTIRQNTTRTTVNYNFSSGDGDYWWRCRANDNISVSDYNYTRRFTVDRRLILTNITSYNDSVFEGTTQIFRINITKNNLTVSDVDSEFIYDNVVYETIKLQENNDRISFYTSLIVPSVPDNPTSNSLNWNFTIIQLNGTLVYNTTFSGVQSVNKLFLDNCSIYGTVIFNFSHVDEETQIEISNGTVETAFNIYTSNRIGLIANFSDTYIDVNPLKICMNENLTENDKYSLDTIVRYEAPDNANEYYNIIDFTLDNNTATQNIVLYDLNLSDSTEFQLTFTGSDFLPVENALVYVDRQYIAENIFKTVELPKTDSNGQTILHLVRNEVIYNIRITKDGIVLGNFENIIAFCDDYSIGNCKIILNAFDSVEEIFNYDEYMGITFTDPEYDETTREVSFTYLAVGGLTKTVQMDVMRSDIFGNRSVCSDTLISSGGTLMCNVPSYIDESTLNIDIYVDNDLVIKDTVEMDTSNYGEAGYLIFFIMVLSIILLFSGSKTGILIGIVLSFAAGIMFGLINSSLIGLGASGLWLIIIVLIGIYKLNSRREQ